MNSSAMSMLTLDGVDVELLLSRLLTFAHQTMPWLITMVAGVILLLDTLIWLSLLF